jgi:hypothetical protein
MHKGVFLIVSLMVFYTNIFAQQVGHVTVTFVDSIRNNRQIVTEVYYPATAAGNNTPIASGVFPIIAFGHGFVMAWSAYQNFWDILVPEGYIIAFPTTEGGLSPNHSEFGKDLKFLISKIQSNGAGPIVPSTSVGNTTAIMGHSMGGGSSFLASQNNVAITTMVSFAAANTNPSSVSASQEVTVPTLLFSGINDCVTPPAQHQNIMYDSTASTYKTQINIIGGGHCFFANSNLSCTFGESTCSPSPTILREQQQAVTNDFLKLWLGYFLKNDCQSAEDFQDSLDVSSRVTYRQSQSIACVTGISEVKKQNRCIVFPNPFSKSISFELPGEQIEQIAVYSLTMQKILEMSCSGAQSKIDLDFSFLDAGAYFVCINNKHWNKVLKNSQ